ncbi:MAG TPA: Gmad2 immunoglobulin-like domain-containing protein, partial [Actinoplanes sp.]|nr:Gmad2 immunoglobulin-like domain-containing protein [Actinoplanes sp.]
MTVAGPAANTVISSPVTVSGTAQTFESTVHMRIRDSRGTEVSTGWTTAAAGGAYSTTLPYIVSSDQAGTVEVFELSAKGDDPTPVEVSKVTVPVQLTARSTDGIAAFSPAAGTTVFSPLRLAGKARVHEGTVYYRIRNKAGVELADGFTTAVNDGDPSDIFRGSFEA